MRPLIAAVATLCLATASAAWAAEAKLPLAPAAPKVPYDLFGAKPLNFERTSNKVVGVYVINESPVSVVDQLKGNSVTHVLYAFLRLCGPGQLPVDAPRCEGKQDHQLTSAPIDQTFDAAFTRLKTRAPHVKVLASVGGWGGSDGFYFLANDAAKRAVFVASSLDFLRKHPSFDGIDIDWEHPGDNGATNGVKLGSAADGQGYADLMTDLRRGLDKLTAETGRLYFVTTAVNPGSHVVNRINFKQAGKALDLVFMMTYDYHGAWAKVTGNHSTLRPSSPTAEDGLERGVRNLTEAGVPAAKLVAGVAMYGRGFTGVSKPVTGTPAKGGYPGSDGSLSYREIARNYLGAKGQGINGYQAVFDETTQAWNLWHSKAQLFMGYDDPRAVLAKGQFVVKAGLAGVFSWELYADNGDVLNAMNFGVGNQLMP